VADDAVKGDEFEDFKRRCERSIALIARQVAHNVMDQDAALAVVEHELRKKVAELEARVETLELEK
jgi:hypothetical protein